MNILNKLKNLISIGHKEAIKKVFERLKRADKIFNLRQTEFEAKRLIEKIAQSVDGKVLDPIQAVPGTKISSDAHNKNLESAFIDLFALYRQTVYLGTKTDTQTVTVQDEFNKSRAAILKLINDARTYTIRSRQPEYDDIKVINFNVAANKNTIKPSAKIDDQTRLLKLPEVGKSRVHLQRRNLRVTTLSVDTKGGTSGQLTHAFPPEKAVDAKTESFWADILYAEVPVVQTYDRYGNDQNGNISNTIYGVISTYTLTFSNPEPLTQIKILPFASQPLKVLAINYRRTLDSETKTQIPNFRIEETLDWVEYNFETIYAMEIEIVFAQENYRKFTIKVPKSILYATDFFVRLQQERAKELTSIPDLLNASVDGTYSIYEEALSDLSSLLETQELEKTPTTEIDLVGKIISSIGSSLAKFNPSLTLLLQDLSSLADNQVELSVDNIETIDRYEYIIGAREIECNHIIYSPIGNYASQQFEPSSTIIEATLEVDERHALVSGLWGNYSATSTEWSVEFSSDKEASIFPSNLGKEINSKAEGERLNINFSSRIGRTRHRAKFSIVSVRMNGDLLKDNVDYINTWLGDDGRIEVEILPHVFDRNYIYTIDYYVSESSKKIAVTDLFLDKQIGAPDSFETTQSNNDIVLSKIPFIKYEVINSDNFAFDDDFNGYRYTPPEPPYGLGVARMYPQWIDAQGLPITGLEIVIPTRDVYGFSINWKTITSGQSEFDGNPAYLAMLPDWASGLKPKYFNLPYKWYVTLSGVPGASYELSPESLGTLYEYGNVSGFALGTTGFYTGHLFTLDQPTLKTGEVGNTISPSDFVGDDGTNGGLFNGHITVPYHLDVVFYAGSESFGIGGLSSEIEDLIYQPIKTTVGGVKAKNITNYSSLEQQAFNISNALDQEHQYIHDGKRLYFNQKLNTEISVDYRYIVEYVQVKCKLRANKIINPTVTPQINEYRLLLNTAVL